MRLSAHEVICRIKDVRSDLASTEFTEAQLARSVTNLGCEREESEFCLALTAEVTELLSEVLFEAARGIPDQASSEWLMGIALAEASLALQLEVHLGLKDPPSRYEYKANAQERWEYPCPWERPPQ